MARLSIIAILVLYVAVFYMTGGTSMANGFTGGGEDMYGRGGSEFYSA